MTRARQIIFRIFYSTSFTIIFLVLIAFICISPTDALYQSYRRRRLVDIFLITGVYVVTALIAALIYASRLYTNRSILKDIPKTYMPIDKADLPTKRVSNLVHETLIRSAVIAFQAKPRSKRIEHDSPNANSRILELLKPESGSKAQHAIKLPFEPNWGPISHAGWSSPAATDLPDLEYATVVAELTDLIEAKAVSLAPLDPLSTPGPDGAPVPDERIIKLLTRPDTAGMRQYITQLMEFEVIANNSLTTAFLTLYERARFASQPLSESEFQSLMRLFAELLRSIKQLNTDLLNFSDDDDDYDNEDDEFGRRHNSDTTHDRHNKKQHNLENPSLSDTSSFVSTSGAGSVLHFPLASQLQKRESSHRGTSRRYTSARVDHNTDSDHSHTDEDNAHSLLTAPPYALSRSHSQQSTQPDYSNMNSRAPSRQSRNVRTTSQRSISKPSSSMIMRHHSNSRQSQTSLAASSIKSDTSRRSRRSRRSGGTSSLYSDRGSVIVRLNGSNVNHEGDNDDDSDNEESGSGHRSRQGANLPYTMEMPRRPSPTRSFTGGL